MLNSPTCTGCVQAAPHPTRLHTSRLRAVVLHGLSARWIVVHHLSFHSTPCLLHSTPCPSPSLVCPPPTLATSPGPSTHNQASFAKAFQRIDLDRSGTIERAELVEALQSWGVNLPIHYLEALFDNCDRDRNGKISCSYPTALSRHPYSRSCPHSSASPSTRLPHAFRPRCFPLLPFIAGRPSFTPHRLPPDCYLTAA